MVETSGKVKAATGLTTQGQGHQTAFAQIVADDLGVKVSDVEIVTGDTRRFGYAVGTFASRGAVMSGSAFHVAAQMVAERRRRSRPESWICRKPNWNSGKGTCARSAPKPEWRVRPYR